MQLKYQFSNNTVTIHYELTDKEIEILKFVESNGFIEFRSSYKEEDRNDDSGQFLESECRDIKEHDFIVREEDAWHDDYVLGERGKFVIRNLIKN